MRSVIARLGADEDLNFLLTNRLPRRLATRVVGYVSKIDSPLLCRLLIGVWQLFTDLDLSDAATPRFRSLHACFTRSLRPGARPTDPRPDVLASPCDAIVGACGRVTDGVLYQVKGFPYALADLLGGADATPFRNGRFVTLRLTSSMYHRFHAPCDLTVDRVSYISGDTWNVNPIALKRIERLFCKNERAVLQCRMEPAGVPILLVPVAAILVASIRLRFLDADRCLRDVARGRGGSRCVVPTADAARRIACDHKLARGEEMGWFEHGSTIIVFTPDGFDLADGITEGTRVLAGQALLRMCEPLA